MRGVVTECDTDHHAIKRVGVEKRAHDAARRRGDDGGNVEARRGNART